MEAYPYEYGRSLASILWAPIPQSVWPEKPPVRIGPAISPAVFRFDADRRTGDPPGIVGEFWINAGLAGVIIGMLVLGAAVRVVDRWYRLVPETSGLSALLYGVFAVALVLRLPRGDFTGVVIEALGQLVILVCLLWILRSRAPGHLDGSSESLLKRSASLRLARKRRARREGIRRGNAGA